jgi:hypothetical protein
MRIFSFATAVAVSLSFTSALAVEDVGEVVAVIDSASASGQVGNRVLAVASRVFLGELVRTDGVGVAQLLFADNTRMVVGPNSSLVIEEFLFRGKAAENKFVIRALGGTFRFISGDSGDKGYSIQTPSGTIGVRGTVIDFSVTPKSATKPKGDTKMILLEGEATLCNEGDEDDEDDCATVVTPCGMLQTDGDEPVEEVAVGESLQEEFDEQFPYVSSQSELREDFQVVGHGCAFGGLASNALSQPIITLGAAAAVGAGALVFGGAIMLLSGGGGSSGSNSTNSTNK